MKDFIKKHKNYIHVIGGALILVVTYLGLAYVEEDRSVFFYLALFVINAVIAYSIEYILQYMGYGKATGKGGLKTLVVPIIFTIYKIIEML